MSILAIDPGTTRSAVCLLAADAAPDCRRFDNAVLFRFLLDYQDRQRLPVLVIEQVGHYGSGMPAGRDIFETVYWSGHFAAAWKIMGGRVERLPRREVKLHLCGSSRAKDANIRQALIDRYGGKAAAIGRKAAPGPLYGIAGDEWAALSVAVTWADREAPP